MRASRSPLSLVLLLGPLLAAPHATQAQHATAFDIVGGQQAYSQFCANCHGPDGDLIANVDLGHGVFRQDYSDEQLIGIIQNGIPNTPMPPNPTMATEQAQLIVSYLRSRAVDPSSTLAGDATNGRELFVDRGFCIYCHMVNGEGEPTGPDLSRIGDIRTAAELTQSLRTPDAVIQPNQRQYAVTTNDGASFSGRLMNQDIFSVQILDASGKLRSFAKVDLAEHGFAPSPMGALGDDWSNQEVADLVAYLVSLRAPTTGGTAP